MAQLTNLKIGLGVNVGGLNNGLSQASKKLSTFATGVDKRLGKVALGNLDKKLTNIGASSVPAAGKLANSFNKAQQPIHGTTYAVTNFNRVIQDAPFGIIGVANNLEPMIQSFNNLKSQTGSTTGAFKTLLTSAFTGPGALITTVSVASSLLIAFSGRMRGASKSSKNAKKSIEGVTEAAKNLNDVLNQDTGFADKISRDIGRNKQAIQLAKEREQIESDIKGLVIANTQNSTTARLNEIDAKREQLQATNSLINALGFEETALDDLESNLQSLEKQQEVYNGVLGTSDTRLAAYVDRLEGEAQKAIDNYEAGITQSTDEIISQRTEIGNLIESFRQLARNGNDEARQAAIVLMEVWNDLNGTLEDSKQKAAEVDKSWLKISTTMDGASESANRLAKSIGKMPKMNVDDSDIEPAVGSIADLQHRLSAFRNMRDKLDPASEGFAMLTGQIKLTKEQINELGGTASESMAKANAGVNQLAGGLGRVVGALIDGKKQALSFGDVVSGVLPGVLSMLGGGPVASFASSLFGGVFHQGGTVPGALGQERLILAQGGETIRTPNQERALSRSGTKNIRITGKLRATGRDLQYVLDEYINLLEK